MSPIHELAEILAHLPGLGPRQARRVVQFLLSKDQMFRKKLADMLVSVGAKAQSCIKCFRFDDPTPSGLCHTCSDHGRDESLLMVVEHDVDIDAVEATLTYRGYYLVLGGLMNLVKQRMDKVIRVEELKKRVGPEVKEVIFALAATPEGDYTAKEISSQLKGVKTSTLGRGLSIGAELEYADPETLRSALKNRN